MLGSGVIKQCGWRRRMLARVCVCLRNTHMHPIRPPESSICVGNTSGVFPSCPSPLAQLVIRLSASGRHLQKKLNSLETKKEKTNRAGGGEKAPICVCECVFTLPNQGRSDRAQRFSFLA